MRYYLAELKIPQHFHPTNLHHKKKKIKTILCEDGEYRMEKKIYINTNYLRKYNQIL